MSNCIKDLFDYDLYKKCSKCGNISLKSNFHKNKLTKSGVRSQCNFCANDYYKNYYNKNRDSELNRCKKYNFQKRAKINEHIKNGMKFDLNFKLASYMRSLLYKAFKSQNVRKINKTFDLLG